MAIEILKIMEDVKISGHFDWLSRVSWGQVKKQKKTRYLGHMVGDNPNLNIFYSKHHKGDWGSALVIVLHILHPGSEVKD